MQFAKDSFFLAVRERLAGLNPARVITVNGATVPAVVVVENLPPSYAEAQPNALYIEWGAAGQVSGPAGSGALMSLEVLISYYSLGSVASMVDRGRVLGQLDGELLSICQPPNTEKRDYTQSPSADLGTRVFWSQPSFSDGTSRGNLRAENSARTGSHPDARVERTAQLKIYFFPEVTLS
jgi:hypothetical protein